MKRLLVVAALLGLTALPAFADPPQTGVIKDRAGYFPSRKQVAVKGTVIGILLTDGQPVLSVEGRSGPADQLVFSSGGNSYRWVYVPTTENPQITNLQVPVGDKGEKQVYPALNMANPRSVVPWGVTAPYSLVEVTVNGGQGSPANDSFVGTSFKVLDGTKDHPLKIADTIGDVKKRYAEHQKTMNIDKAMAELADKTLKDKKATGPRETSDLMYVTWLPETETLQVRFKTKISDGSYTITKGPIGPKLPPFKLPPQKVGCDNSVPVRVIAPGLRQTKTGTMFGIEFGMAYDVNNKGEIVRMDELPIETFTQQINTTGFGPRPGPQPLPPQKVQPDLE